MELAVYSLSAYSIIMGIGWFTIALLLGSFLIIHCDKVRYKLVLVIFLLGLIRVLLPFKHHFMILFQDWNVYAFLRRLWNLEIQQGITIGTILLITWAIGTVVCLVNFIYQLVQIYRISQRARTVSKEEPLYKICETIVRSQGYKRNFRIAITKDFSTAVMVGFLTPVILIPEEVTGFSEGELHGICKHEFTHFLLRDVGLQWGLNLLQCLFWWNPVVYYLKKSLEQLIELRCDARACDDMEVEERIHYLDGIVRVLKNSDAREVRLGVGYAKKHSAKFLQKRFAAVLEPVKKQSKRVTAVLAGVCVAVFVLSYGFIIQPAGNPDASELEGTREPEEGEETPDFLLKIGEGLYMYFEDNIEAGILSEAEIMQPPYSGLPVYEYSEGE